MSAMILLDKPHYIDAEQNKDDVELHIGKDTILVEGTTLYDFQNAIERALHKRQDDGYSI